MTEQKNELMDLETIKMAKAMAGSGGDKVSIPFIPVIRINNKSEEKEVEIDGEKKLVEVPAKKGFLLKTKDDNGDYKEEYWQEDLSGVILKERYEIQSKYGTEDFYYSYEFDTWVEPIKVYDKNKQVLIEGSYSDLKNHFSIEELDSRGNKKKSFELFLVLYLNVDGEVKRYRAKMNQNNKWFDYKNEFGTDDTYVAYKTNFELEQKKAGDNKFWVANYVKGEKVNIKEQIDLQKEMLSYMGALKDTFNQGESKETGVQQEVEVLDAEDINIEDIPF